MMNLFRFIAFRNLLDKPIRTSLTLLGVTLGVGLFISIDLINEATLQSFSDTILNVSGEADMSVTAGELGFPEDRLQIIEDTPGIEHAVPVIEEQTHFINGDQTDVLYVMGVDLLREPAVRSYRSVGEEIMDDPQIFLNQPDSIIVSSSFAKRYGFGLDSKMVLSTSRGKRTFTIRGILSDEGVARAYGGSIALMDIDGARVTFGKDNKMDRVDIVLKKGVSLPEVTASLKKALGPGYKVERPEERAQSLAHLISSFQGTLRMVASLALIIGLLLVANSLKIAVTERRREIGIVRSLGATSTSIAALFVFEALCLGLLGAGLGCFAGRVMAEGLVSTVARGMSTRFLMHIQTPTITLQTFDIIRALIIGTITAGLAGFFPALSASRIQPVEAMSNRPKLDTGSHTLSHSLKMALLGIFIIFIFLSSSILRLNLKSRWIETLHQLAGPPALILLTPFLTLILAMVLAWFVRRLDLGITLRLAQDNLVREPGRAANNILTLGLGLYLVIVIATINASFKESIKSWANRSLVADLVVSSFGNVGSLQPKPLTASLKSEIMAIPAVRAALNGNVSGLRFIHTEFQGKTIAIKAFDEPSPGDNGEYSDGYMFDVLDDDRITVTKKIFAKDMNNLAISRNMADNFHLKVGDSFELDTPNGQTTFHIVGLVTDFSSHEGVLYMPRTTFTKLWSDDLINMFYLSLRPGFDRIKVKRAIDQEVGIHRGLMVRFNEELKSEIMTAVEQSFTYTSAIEFAALLCGLIGMMNMMLISVLERTREIGLLRAVGMSRRQIFLTILFESCTQGTIAGIIAVTVGLSLAYVWIHFSLAHVLGWAVDFYLPLQSIWTSVLLGVIVASIAGLLPAVRASRFDIKESLTYE